MQTIKISNGDTLQFPDEMSDDQIQDAIHKEYGGSPAMPESPAPKKGKLERAADLADTYITNPLREAGQGFQQATANAGKGIANLGIHAANLIPGVDINTLPAYDFAPKTPNAMGGEFASYFVGGGLAKAASKAGEATGLIRAAMNSPTIRGALQKASSFATRNPRTAGIAGAIAGQGLQGAIYNPNDQAMGAAFGAGGGLLGEATQVTNPFVRALGRAGLGAGLGYGVGGERGAEYGAIAGLASPVALKKIGLTGERPGRETLRDLRPEDVQSQVEAANRLGTPITPAEASGNPYIGRQEGYYGKTGEAAAEKTRIGMERVEKQKTAITDLLDTIYDKSAASKQKITDLYKAANKWNLKDEVVNKFRQDPVIADAFKAVESDSAYQRKLAGVSPNNIAYLNQVKRALSDMEGKALRVGEKDRAAEFKDARTNLVSAMDEAVPAYKQARNEAQRSIVRSNIQKVLNKKEVKGSTFFDSLLKNDEKYNQLLSSLKNVPEAQDKIRDMKTGWKNLINIETPRAAAGKSETSMNLARDSIAHLATLWDEMTGSTRNKEALKYIHSGKWQYDLPEIVATKNKDQRLQKYSKLLGKLVGATFTAVNSNSGEQ